VVSGYTSSPTIAGIAGLSTVVPLVYRITTAGTITWAKSFDHQGFYAPAVTCLQDFGISVIAFTKGSAHRILYLNTDSGTVAGVKYFASDSGSEFDHFDDNKIILMNYSTAEYLFTY